MNQRKSKQLRREFRELGIPEKGTAYDTRKRLAVKDDKIETEEYLVETTKNNYRRFKKERIKK